VGDDHFANGWTSYNKALDTLTYDVTRQLRAGTNSLEAVIGSGWYAGRLMSGRNKYGAHPDCCFNWRSPTAMALAKSCRRIRDGKGPTPGRCFSSSLYDGESYDARKAVTKLAGRPGGFRPRPGALTPNRSRPCGKRRRWRSGKSPSRSRGGSFSIWGKTWSVGRGSRFRLKKTGRSPSASPRCLIRMARFTRGIIARPDPRPVCRRTHRNH